VQEANASALQLKDESGDLSELVGRFRVDRQLGQQQPAPAARPSGALAVRTQRRIE
jgi:hypothetical protein